MPNVSGSAFNNLIDFDVYCIIFSVIISKLLFEGSNNDSLPDLIFFN